jgi:hypothetical protein
MWLLVGCSLGARTPTPLALPSPQAVNTATPTAAITPVFSPQRVTFPRGSTSVTLPAQLGPGVAAGYVLRVMQGQKMTVRAMPRANIVVLDGQGQAIASAIRAIQVTIPQTGDYTVVVSGNGNVQVEITIPPP